MNDRVVCRSGVSAGESSIAVSLWCVSVCRGDEVGGGELESSGVNL